MCATHKSIIRKSCCRGHGAWCALLRKLSRFSIAVPVVIRVLHSFICELSFSAIGRNRILAVVPLWYVSSSPFFFLSHHTLFNAFLPCVQWWSFTSSLSDFLKGWWTNDISSSTVWHYAFIPKFSLPSYPNTIKMHGANISISYQYRM